MIFQDEFIKVEFETSEIPWVKIFTQKEFKELGDMDENTKNRLFSACFIVEKALLELYSPDKINWASFANYVPKVHMHIQARFKDDSFFPESMWGKKMRDGKIRNLNLDEFSKFLNKKLSNI